MDERAERHGALTGGGRNFPETRRADFNNAEAKAKWKALAPVFTQNSRHRANFVRTINTATGGGRGRGEEKKRRKKGGEEILAQSLAILREELRSKSLVRRPALSMAWQIDLTDRFRVTLRYCSRRVSHEKLAISIGVTIVRGESFCFSCSNHALGSFYTILGSFSLLKEVVNGETIDDRSISNHSVRPS